MKKLLTAVFAVAALVVVTPSAEARCGRRCAPKRCEEAPKCETPKCDVKKEIVGKKLIPCCRMVKEIGLPAGENDGGRPHEEYHAEAQQMGRPGEQAPARRYTLPRLKWLYGLAFYAGC